MEEEDYKYIFDDTINNYHHLQHPLPPPFQFPALTTAVPPAAAAAVGSLSVPYKMLSFDRSSSSFHENDDDPFEIAISAPKGRSNRSRIDANEHIIAERKRREKLNQRLIELSSLVPGLKKKDKASILEDAINYMKHLQEKIKQLEEDMITKKKMSGSIESVVLIKKHQKLPSFDIHDHDYSNDPFLNVVDEENLELSTLPEIEARRSEKDVMIRIHCEKHNGVLAKVLSELESLHLIVVNCSVFSFGNSTIYITIIAQMVEDDGDQLCVTVKDMVNNLRLAVLDHFT